MTSILETERVYSYFGAS